MTNNETKAYTAFKNKHWEEGMALALKTEKTNPTLQYYMGYCYYIGAGVEKNDNLAFHWYCQAAKQGYALAQFMLGNCYRNGRGVKQDSYKALKLYKAAAENGCLMAKYELAQCYETGVLGEASEVMAFRYCREAAEDGYKQAFYKYARYLDEGFGTERDTNLASIWYSKAYATGNAEAGKIIRAEEKQVAKCLMEDSTRSDGENENNGEAMAELNQMIGLTSVKQQVATLQNRIKLERRRAEIRNREFSVQSNHFVFMGNPGTGKTNVARILAKLLHEIGITKTDKFIETDRSGLVAEYTGQTGPKTNGVINRALDGVLFIDEAYSLITDEDDDFGKEAVTTLLRRMENDRNRIVVIVAGYTEDMQKFLDSNPGLRGRFSNFIKFPDYTAEELLRIFELNVEQAEMTLAEGVKELAQAHFQKVLSAKPSNFDNGRYVRRVFQEVMDNVNNRLGPILESVSDKDVFEITLADVEQIKENKHE